MKRHWFTSDTHFNHEKILWHMPYRGLLFRTIEEMDAELVDMINKYVKPGDVLWHLGDFCWRAGLAGHYRARLNVKELHVCQGNHDTNSLRKHVSSMDWMKFPKIQSNFRSNIHLHLQHFPCYSWRKMQKGGYHLYGHSHGLFEAQLDKWMPERQAMDVGVDNAFNLTGEFRPLELEEVLFHMGTNVIGRLDR